MRVYRDVPGSIRRDERGTYEGWGDRYDEWVPIFSPRIQPWGTDVKESSVQELDDTQDDLI